MASTPSAFRNGAVGFIDWLGLSGWNRHRLSIVCDENWQFSLRDLDVFRHRYVDAIYAEHIAVAKPNIVETIIVTVGQGPVPYRHRRDSAQKA